MQIFLAKRLVPAEAYNFFIDILLDTIRDEISLCVEKSYTRLSQDAAAKALNFNKSQLQAYATKVQGFIKIILRWKRAKLYFMFAQCIFLIWNILSFLARLELFL